jgi:hypothetical protein
LLFASHFLGTDGKRPRDVIEEVSLPRGTSKWNCALTVAAIGGMVIGVAVAVGLISSPVFVALTSE